MPRTSSAASPLADAPPYRPSANRPNEPAREPSQGGRGSARPDSLRRAAAQRGGRMVNYIVIACSAVIVLAAVSTCCALLSP